MFKLWSRDEKSGGIKTDATEESSGDIWGLEEICSISSPNPLVGNGLWEIIKWRVMKPSPTVGDSFKDMSDLEWMRVIVEPLQRISGVMMGKRQGLLSYCPDLDVYNIASMLSYLAERIGGIRVPDTDPDLILVSLANGNDLVSLGCKLLKVKSFPDNLDYFCLSSALEKLVVYLFEDRNSDCYAHWKLGSLFIFLATHLSKYASPEEREKNGQDDEG